MTTDNGCPATTTTTTTSEPSSPGGANNGNIEQFNGKKTIQEKNEEEVKKKESNLSPRKMRILASLVYGNLFLGTCYSLLAPFFPAEAERKGATATQYGFIFGIYQLVMFLASPIHGKIVPVVKPGFLLKAGMLTSGICSILFGTLIYVPSGTPFIALAFTIRIIDAIGASAFLTASYTVLGCEFSDIIGRAMSIAETAFSCGLAIGPVIGGFLYGLGGFGTPFYVVGALLLAGTVVNFILFANMDSMEEQKSGSARKILSDVDFCLDSFVIITCFMSLGFNEATLEPHIRQFGLSSSAIGGIFLIEGLVDALTAFVWGYFAEKTANAQHFTIIAIFMFTMCFLIIGPVPFLTFPTMLWVIIISQVLLGLGMAGEIVCSFTHGMKNAVSRGFPENAGTYGMVSGLLFSSACLGGFAGPALGGYLVDTVGYKASTMVIFCVKIAIGIVMSSRLIYLAFKKRRSRKLTLNQEAAPEIKDNHI